MTYDGGAQRVRCFGLQNYCHTDNQGLVYKQFESNVESCCKSLKKICDTTVMTKNSALQPMTGW